MGRHFHELAHPPYLRNKVMAMFIVLAGEKGYVKATMETFNFQDECL